jgi:hypothetical protein
VPPRIVVQAEAGDFPSAVKSHEKVLPLMPKDGDTKGEQRRLDLYKSGKPCRDEPKKDAAKMEEKK